MNNEWRREQIAETDEGGRVDFARLLQALKDGELGIQQEENIELRFPSVTDARMALLGRSNVAQRISLQRAHMAEIAQWVIDHKGEISGDAADWHMLVNPFFECGDYKSAMQIASAGRERFPYDATLLGDAIRCAGNLGDWEEGDALVKQAKQADYRADEDWSLAVYVSEYFTAKAKSQDEAGRTSTVEEALTYIREAESRLPENDRLYNAEAGVLIEAGRIIEARELLETVVFAKKDEHPVPQCCLTYLQKVLADSCDYKKVIDVANAGIRYATTEQESVGVHYFFYRKALAMDGQINERESFGDEECVKEALQTYALAYALTEHETYKEVCRKRFLILSALGKIDGMRINMYYEAEDLLDKA